MGIFMHSNASIHFERGKSTGESEKATDARRACVVVARQAAKLLLYRDGARVACQNQMTNCISEDPSSTIFMKLQKALIKTLCKKQQLND
jgi:hypothetical protein